MERTMDTTQSVWIQELGALMLSIVLMAWYLNRAKQPAGHKTPLMKVLNQDVRSAWVRSVMELPNKEIMAVQTLRNSIMASSLMATTAAVVMMGVMTLSGEHGKISEAWSALHADALPAKLVNVKVVLLEINLFASLLSFGMSVRYFGHVAYMLSLPPEYRGEWFHPPFVAGVLNKAGDYYSTGLRLFYFVGPLVAWFLSGALLVLATLILVMVLYRMDRAPIAHDFSS
jgi:uncharacterized membrane protein